MLAHLTLDTSIEVLRFPAITAEKVNVKLCPDGMVMDGSKVKIVSRRILGASTVTAPAIPPLRCAVKVKELKTFGCVRVTVTEVSTWVALFAGVYPKLPAVTVAPGLPPPLAGVMRLTCPAGEGAGVAVSVIVIVGAVVAELLDIGVMVAVAADVAVEVRVGVAPGVEVAVTVAVSLETGVAVSVAVAVAVAVEVAVGVAVAVPVAVAVGVAVAVAVGVGTRKVPYSNAPTSQAVYPGAGRGAPR